MLMANGTEMGLEIAKQLDQSLLLNPPMMHFGSTVLPGLVLLLR